MSDTSRILCPVLSKRLMSAEEAAEMIPAGAKVGMSGFTGAGYPKAVPGALAERIRYLNAQPNAKPFRISVWTGASTAPELDGVLAEVDGIEMRLPFQSDPICRSRINNGTMDYVDYHLSEVSQYAWSGFLGKMDIALIEVAGIREDGSLIPSSSIGNNKTWIEQADKIIIEVNSKQNAKLEGMHDIYYGTALPPNRKPIMLTDPADRIGEQYLACPPEKVIAVVETAAADRNSPFKPSDDVSKKIAGHILDFFNKEIELGRLPKELLPIQSGVGNIRRRTRRPGFRPLQGSDRLHRGDSGRHAENAQVRHPESGIRDCLFAEPGWHRRVRREYRFLPRQDHSAPAGHLQPPGAGPSSGCNRDEWSDRM